MLVSIDADFQGAIGRALDEHNHAVHKDRQFVLGSILQLMTRTAVLVSSKGKTVRRCRSEREAPETSSANSARSAVPEGMYSPAAQNDRDDRRHQNLLTVIIINTSSSQLVDCARQFFEVANRIVYLRRDADVEATLKQDARTGDLICFP